VYLDTRGYRTNGPSPALIGLLEQRQMSPADFNPDSLNHPDSQTFIRSTLGVDVALFEGGMKQAQVGMFDHTVRAEKLGASQVEAEQYAQSGFAYGSIASIQKQKEKLQALSANVAKLISGYQLGQKSNPVGYSGLLGMKSLANRVAGYIDQLDAQEKSAYTVIKEMGLSNVNWTPQPFDARGFADQYLAPPQAKAESQSYKSLAGTESAQAGAESAKMARARYLPKVGAFAESYIFNGDRDTANGYTAGLYLQWSIFDPADFGKYKAAKLSARAAERLNQASIRIENAERESLAAAEKALRSNLARLDESDKLLAEQIRVSSTLFKNGSIGALQFTEILNRRMDLISQQSEAELELLKAASARITKSRINLPAKTGTGE
jgi:hypothetical protein